MSDFDWKATLRSVAPTLGGVLATGLTGNPAAGLAVRAASEALLGKADGTKDEIAQAVVAANPDQLLALKQADNQFRLDLERVGIDLDKIAQEDRASARALAIQTTLIPQIALTIIYALGYFGLLYMMTTGTVQVDNEMKMEFAALVGVLTAVQAQIFNFWFGTSKGSHDKTAMMLKR